MVYDRFPYPVALWDLRRRIVAWKSSAEETIRGVSVTERGSLMLVSGESRIVREYNPADGKTTIFGEVESAPRLARFSPDFRRLAYVGTGSRNVKVLDLNTHAVAELEAPVDVETMGWSRDGAYLAGACSDTSVSVWNVTEKRLISQLRGHLTTTACACQSSFRCTTSVTRWAP